MNIQELKQEKQNKVDQLMKACLVFFAFSNEQYHANKTPLEPDEKYVSLGAGGYIPKGKVKAFTDGLNEIDTWYKQAVKDNKQREADIEYELANHEAYYTGTIEQTLEALGDDYTAEEVKAVYRKTLKKHNA